MQSPRCGPRPVDSQPAWLLLKGRSIALSVVVFACSIFLNIWLAVIPVRRLLCPAVRSATKTIIRKGANIGETPTKLLALQTLPSGRIPSHIACFDGLLNPQFPHLPMSIKLALAGLVNNVWLNSRASVVYDGFCKESDRTLIISL